MKSRISRTLLTAIAIIAITISVALAAPTTNKYRIVWSGDVSSSATIAWDQLSGENPVVYYGPKDFGTQWDKYPLQQKPTRKVLNYRGMNNHFAKLTDIKADQDYYFVIKDSEDISDRYWFKTAPDKPQPFTFIAGGDTKSSGTALEAGRLSNQMVAKLRPLFIVFVGDFCSGNGTDAERWQLWLDDWSRLTTSEDGRMYPVVPVHGNHEDGEKDVLYNLFDVPVQFDNNENVYYDMSFGDIFAFLSLNSQIDEGGNQRAWLEEKLIAYKDYTFTSAGYHKPFFPHYTGKSENEQQYEQWAPLFFKHGLDLSFDGDTHMSKITFPLRPSQEAGSHQGFIRDDENGTMFIGEGSWGASPRKADDKKPWTIRSGQFNQLKWLHVFPEKNGNPAHVDIRTIITATFDEDENITGHVENVANLSEENLFAIPQNLNMFSTEPYGAVIQYPFKQK